MCRLSTVVLALVLATACSAASCTGTFNFTVRICNTFTAARFPVNHRAGVSFSEMVVSTRGHAFGDSILGAPDWLNDGAPNITEWSQAHLGTMPTTWDAVPLGLGEGECDVIGVSVDEFTPEFLLFAAVPALPGVAIQTTVGACNATAGEWVATSAALNTVADARLMVTGKNADLSGGITPRIEFPPVSAEWRGTVRLNTYVIDAGTNTPWAGSAYAGSPGTPELFTAEYFVGVGNNGAPVPDYTTTGGTSTAGAWSHVTDGAGGAATDQPPAEAAVSPGAATRPFFGVIALCVFALAAL